MSDVKQSAGGVVSISSAVEKQTPLAPSIQVEGLPAHLAGQRAAFLGARSNLTYLPEAPPLVALSLARLRLVSELATKAEALLLGLAHSQQYLLDADGGTGEEGQLHIEITRRLISLNSALLSVCFGDSLTLRELAQAVHGPRVHLWPQWLQDARTAQARAGAASLEEV